MKKPFRIFGCVCGVFVLFCFFGGSGTGRAIKIISMPFKKNGEKYQGVLHQKKSKTLKRKFEKLLERLDYDFSCILARLYSAEH